jgi:hypothetical protein
MNVSEELNLADRVIGEIIMDLRVHPENYAEGISPLVKKVRGEIGEVLGEKSEIARDIVPTIWAANMTLGFHTFYGRKFNPEQLGFFSDYLDWVWFREGKNATMGQTHEKFLHTLKRMGLEKYLEHEMTSKYESWLKD